MIHVIKVGSPAVGDPRRTAGVSRSRARFGAQILALLALPLVAPPAAGESAAAAVEAGDFPPLRFGFSRNILDAVNESDGRAALRMHAETIAKSDRIAIIADLPLLDGVPAIRQALETGQVDLLTLTAGEYLALPPGAVTGPFIAAANKGKFEEQYLLVVRNDRNIHGLSGLKGSHVLIQQGGRAALSSVWLEVLAMDAGLGPLTTAFANVTAVGKPSRLVLPVFFGQADACVVTQRSFEVMKELNPQLGRQLSVIARSVPVVPSLLCFRAGVSPQLRERYVNVARKMQTTVSGLQLLTIFQSDSLAVLPPESLESARALLAQRAHLMEATDTARSASARVMP